MDNLCSYQKKGSILIINKNDPFLESDAEEVKQPFSSKGFQQFDLNNMFKISFHFDEFKVLFTDLLNGQAK